MSAGEVVGLADVEQRRLEGVELLDGPRRSDERAAVQLDDPLEVRRPRRTHVGRLGRELVLVGRLRHPVEAPFETDRRRGFRAHGRAAEGPGDVAGEDLDAVGELQQALQARVELARTVGRIDGEVRPSGVAHEQRVSREHEPWFLAAAPVDHDEAAVLGAVAGSVEHAQGDLSSDELVTAGRRLVLVGRAGGRMDRDRDPVLEGEPAVPGDVVGVRMRLERADDPNALLLGRRQVLLDLVPGIDDERLARRSVTDQVRRAAEVGVDELAEDHSATLPTGSACFLEVTASQGASASRAARRTRSPRSAPRRRGRSG